MAYIMYFLAMIAPCMAEYCEFYFYADDMTRRSYYKFCSDGCCSNYCCLYYISDTSPPSYPPVGIIIGCLVGLGICIGICVCVFKFCCKSEAAQAGQIIQRPGQQVAYVQSQTASGNSYGQQINMAYGYPELKFDDIERPPAYEDCLSYPSPAMPSSYNNINPSGAVITDGTRTDHCVPISNVATISGNNIMSTASVPQSS